MTIVRTGQWIHRGSEPGWWFDSGAVSLDFAHTGAHDGPPSDDALSTAADLDAWLAERFERLGDEAADRTLIDAIALRTAIYRLMRAATDGTTALADDIDTVNLFAATPDIPPALEGGNRQAGRSRVHVTQALASIARDTVAVLGTNHDGRIRECAAEDCELIFYDESRTNNRRWCSMQRCGNRAKVRSFRARTAP